MKIEYEHIERKPIRNVSHSLRNTAGGVSRSSCLLSKSAEDFQSGNRLEKFEVRKILVPTDFSDCAAHALRNAIRLAKQHGATITLLHVVDLNLHTPPVGPAHADELREDLWKEGLVKLGEMAMGLASEHVEVRTLIREGLPAEEIAEVARAHDVIVIGKPKTKGFWRWFSRRTVEALLRCAPCPVLVIHEPQETLGINQNQV